MVASNILNPSVQHHSADLLRAPEYGSRGHGAGASQHHCQRGVTSRHQSNTLIPQCFYPQRNKAADYTHFELVFEKRQN
jgi:hypothetical protein